MWIILYLFIISEFKVLEAIYLTTNATVTNSIIVKHKGSTPRLSPYDVISLHYEKGVYCKHGICVDGLYGPNFGKYTINCPRGGSPKLPLDPTMNFYVGTTSRSDAESFFVCNFRS